MMSICHHHHHTTAAVSVELQEEEQFSDGIDGPSIFTDPAVPPATLIGFASKKL